MFGGFRGNCSAGAEAQDASGEDGRYFAEALVGGHDCGVGVGSHGTAPWWSAHSDLRGAAGRLSGRIENEASTYIALQVGFEMTHRGPKGNGLVTPRGLVTRDSESFGGRVSGIERNLQGSARTPIALARTGEREPAEWVGENSCGKGANHETPRRPTLGVFW